MCIWDEYVGIVFSFGLLDVCEVVCFFFDGDVYGQLVSFVVLYFGFDLDCCLSLLVSGGVLLCLECGVLFRLSWNIGLWCVEDGQWQCIDFDLWQLEVV